MPEKQKKLRLYKFASEYNLSTDSLVEFLNERNYKINSHMSLLTEDMIVEIQERFKKDIEKAEKHYKKISEFNKRRSEKASADGGPAGEGVEPVQIDVGPLHSKEETETKEVVEEIESPQTEVEETIEEVAETEVELEPESEIIAETELTETESAEESVEEDDSEEVKIFKTQSEIDLKNKKKGLTIVGKIELEQKKKAADKKEKAVKETKPAVSEEEAKKEETKEGKKKRKKVLKAKKKTTTDGADEEVTRHQKKRKIKRLEVDKKEVDAAIKRTLLSMDESSVGGRASVRKKKRKEKLEIKEKIQEEINKEKTKLKVTEYIAVNELANLMHVPVADVIQKCIGLGMMVSINQRLDNDSITLVADEFEFEVEFQEEYAEDLLDDIEDPVESLQFRPPVVTIMGHVDHGKTSLLDYIRSANVVAGESGGITQHIGAYKVQVNDDKFVTFLDTPGHEAFTAMRARGASVTDIVILIVAADDAVMPQTVEAINHAQAAEVPIIIAINKIDKPNSNIEKIKQQLAERNILIEEWGGKYQCVEISAKAGTNVDVLLEKIALEAELLELKANYDRNARGTVIETELDKGRGITSTVLVQKGTLNIGDPFVAGNHHGRVRAMFDERNKKVDSATPSTPVLVLGFEGSPQAGDVFVIVDSEREAREISIKRLQLKREQDHRQVNLITLDEIAAQVGKGAIKELPLVVKCDADGSVEALSDSLMKLSNEEVKVEVIHRGVGAISEGDVLLAAASKAIIVGFHVRPNTNARKLAESEKVDVRLYNVIYDAINEVKSALEGLLSPILSEELIATVEVRETFKVPKIGTVAGCYVQDGKISRSDKIRLFRDGVVTYEGHLATLRRFKDDVKDVDAGYECGLNITNYNDIKVGDIIEAYKVIETKKKLA